MDDDTLMRCEHCGAPETYDDSTGFSLLAWWACAQAFDARHAACRPTMAPSSPKPPEGAHRATSGHGEAAP